MISVCGYKLQNTMKKSMTDPHLSSHIYELRQTKQLSCIPFKEVQ